MWVCANSFQLCLTLCGLMDCSPSGSSVHGDSPGQNTKVGSHALLQGNLLSQRSNLYLMTPLLAGEFFTTGVCFPGSSADKESTCNAGDLNSIPGSGRSPREGIRCPPQYSRLENPHGQRSLVPSGKPMV